MGHISTSRERRRDRWPDGGPISWITIAAATVILAGCMTLGHVAAVLVIAAATALVPRVALAPGGESLRGIAHIGVLAEMERAGMRPSLVVGSSAGSLVGALWAAAVRASSGIPVLFEPVRSQGRLLVDGSLAAPTPVRADVVIAPDIRRLGTITTDSRDALVEVGREAARTAMPAIQEAVRAWRMQRGLLTATRN